MLFKFNQEKFGDGKLAVRLISRDNVLFKLAGNEVDPGIMA